MAFDFDKLKPEAKRAAFAHMRLGSGSRHKKLSARQKGAVEDKSGKATISGKLGSGSVKGKLSPADHDKGSVGGKLPIAKARQRPTAKTSKPSAPAEPAADTPAARFDQALTEDMDKLTRNRSSSYASMVELRKTLGDRGLSRDEQDKHLKRMSGEGKISIVPEDNRKALTQEDHDAAIHLGGEPNHLVTLADGPAKEHAKMRAAAKPEDRYTGLKNLSASNSVNGADLAKQFVEAHGAESVQPRIAFLEKKKRLLPGERAQLAALKSLGKK